LIFVNILLDPNVTLLTWDDVDGIWYLKGPYGFAVEQNEDVKWVYNKEKGKYVLSILVVCSIIQLYEFSTNVFSRALLVWKPPLLLALSPALSLTLDLHRDLSLLLYLVLGLLLLTWLFSHPQPLRHLKSLRV
jgi:hypothetical protein